jgi:hypothetical protein
MTIWSVFPDTTKYFMASPSSFMANYIVDDLDALLDRLAKAGARIDPKRGAKATVASPRSTITTATELWQPV